LYLEDLMGRVLSRRTALKAGAAAAVASQGLLLEQLAYMPQRAALAATPSFSDIQFDVGRFLRGPQTFNDGGGSVVADFGATFMLFVPAKLTRNPTKADQATLSNALATIEANFSASPSGLLIASVSYGMPYFARLPQALVQSKIPRLLDPNGNPTSRFALENAVPGPTDVVNGKVQGANGTIPKERFMVNVVLETNDINFQFRSDSIGNLAEATAWLEGSGFLGGRFQASPDFDGLFNFQEPRLQFVQPGLPRKVANALQQQDAALGEFAPRVNPNTSMVMGFVDQAVDSSAATADIVTFVGSKHGVFTNAKAGDYFDNGSIMHFSHVIDDLYQFYQTAAQDPTGGGGEPFTERVQYMFRSNQVGSGQSGLPSVGNTDQFTDGGGPAFLNNVFQGRDAAQRGAIDANKAAPNPNDSLDKTFNGQQRIGHEVALQRVSRSTDGTGMPLHIRNDGPGLSGMDVPAFETFPGQPTISKSFPAGTPQFKLQFAIFVPTSEFFRQLREAAGAQDLMAKFGQPNDPGGTSGGVQFADNGLERFLTATRRQNFLVPPRRHRSFPLIEFT
jgi:hypothetical protein